MTDRIIDISENGAFLKVDNRLLVISPKDGEKATVPLEDIGVLLLSNKAVTLTHPVLSRLSEAGAVVVVTDEKHLPSAMMLPLQNHSVQTERMRIQSDASLPVKKQIWKQLISAKIANQSELLKRVKSDDSGLSLLSEKVRSGDPENIEARAAILYWKELGIVSKRERFADDANRFLNYGYAVLNAVCARALCASGLHPSLGVNHHNRYNNFTLASDIMEPFRPMMDFAVFNIIKQFGSGSAMTKEIRSSLVSTITGRVIMNAESVPFFFALTRLCGSLVNFLSGESKKLSIPEDIFNFE